MSEIYGLVVCGGQSTRMGADKSLLDYHGRPQRYYLYEQLQPVCDAVFLSCNEQQAATIPAAYNVIIDKPVYNNTGPMAALLSAFDQYPDKTFLVVACDYPFFSKEEIEQLVAVAEQETDCAAFCHRENNIYEPLLAIYKPGAGALVTNAFSAQQHSLQRLLKEIQAVKLFATEEHHIQSIDTPEGYREAAFKTKQKK